MADFTLNVDADGVATIIWDVPENSINVLSYGALAEMNAHVDTVLADGAIKGAIITSGKKDFVGGMDLNVIAQMNLTPVTILPRFSLTVSWAYTPPFVKLNTRAWIRRPTKAANRLLPPCPESRLALV